MSLTGATFSAMVRWLAARGREPGRLFLPLSVLGNTLTRSKVLQMSTIAELVRKRGKEAGIGKINSTNLMRGSEDDQLEVPDEVPDVSDEWHKYSPTALGEPDAVRAGLVAAAKSLAAYRNRSDPESSLLSELKTDELERL